MLEVCACQAITVDAEVLTGFLASLLVKLLLEKGHSVNMTVWDHVNEKKISPLLALKSLGNLKLSRADLTDEASLNDPIAGGDTVFHVATPINFASEDPEIHMIKPAIEGVINVTNACAKLDTVKCVILTSSAAAITINQFDGKGLVMDEENWSDAEFLTSKKPPTWGNFLNLLSAYPVSKILAEKTARKFARENNIDLITIIPSLIAGPSLTPDIPPSISLATSLITGNESLINQLKGMQILSGSISLTHVEDVCRAHVFIAEKKSASGRYICCAVNSSFCELAKFLNERFSMYEIPTDFGEFPSEAKLIISSVKIIKEGFSFKYGIEEIYDQSVVYLKANDLLQN
ncbi:anthocyanidin reductase [Olea europaea subsp. europaea]|uniref:Dihydroflavonol 4-reductase n=1 Tax=Olea europaea subsp. europaea TaxID=158383 RepID=A0A8S0P9D4_OLEEU|nr:anthocyanidin reductase [Olea europaea subsp. europaea]